MMLQMMMEIYGYNGNNKTVQASAGISSLPQFCPHHSPFMMLTMMMVMMLTMMMMTMMMMMVVVVVLMTGSLRTSATSLNQPKPL